jgi:YD repeat-containing protein
MPSVIETRNSKGENEKIQILYAGDEDSGAPSIMYKSADSENKYDINYKHLIYQPVRITKEVNGKITERSENFYTADGTKVHLTKSRQYPTGSSEYLESLYSYDNLSNLINIKSNDGISKSLTWGHHSSYVVAEAINAEPEEIYYEGFEEKDTEVSSDAKTGLKSSTAALSIQLPAAGNYILSYWAKSNGFWKYKEDPVSANTTIGGPDVLIDEVRLRPEKARVTTRQFHPGLGVISETDANNNTVYYEYDSFGRLKLQRDTDKNLVKVLEYQIRQK